MYSDQKYNRPCKPVYFSNIPIFIHISRNNLRLPFLLIDRYWFFLLLIEKLSNISSNLWFLTIYGACASAWICIRVAIVHSRGMFMLLMLMLIMVMVMSIVICRSYILLSLNIFSSAKWCFFTTKIGIIFFFDIDTSPLFIMAILNWIITFLRCTSNRLMESILI